MYAAAGGASLASRQARQRQRQNKKAAAQKASKASDILPKPPQKGQFHNYTDEAVPRLSRVERNALKPPTPAAAAPSERRHSTSNYHLKEPARARIRESPSICLPVHTNHVHCHAGLGGHHLHHAHGHMAGSGQQPPPTALRSPSITSHQLPQILIPEDDKSLERRCSFVRQVEEEKDGEKGVLDRCNHMCNFEIKEQSWEQQEPGFYTEYDFFGSLDYPFSEGRTAWQERERGRRCSLSDEARQHRLKQSEAHHRWLKRNRIHDTTFGGSSEEDFFDVYHQSAAANALLYVGLGTIAIGAVIFFVGTGEKGFKTLELRLIGPTLVACGLLCCLVRVLLCACPSTCLRAAGRGGKSRCKNACATTSNCDAHHLHHGGGDASCRCPFTQAASLLEERRTTHASTSFEKHKKKVSIVTGASNNHNHAVPGTSGAEAIEQSAALIQVDAASSPARTHQPLIPIITLPDADGGDGDTAAAVAAAAARMHREESLIELEHLDAAVYDLQSISSYESETVIEVECKSTEAASKHTRARAPALTNHGGDAAAPSTSREHTNYDAMPLPLPLQLPLPPQAASGLAQTADRKRGDTAAAPAYAADGQHSGIVLSPLQLGQ